MSLTVRWPAGDGANGIAPLLRDGLHCLTCGRPVVACGGDAVSLACPEHGRLLAAEVWPLRREQTVTIVATAGHGHGFRLVARVRDGRRHWVPGRRVRPLSMDDWQWDLP
jgi:hypothetical protein